MRVIKNSGGFTLLELFATMAIAGILLSIAVPSFRTLILNNRITTQTNDFISALNLARSEAIKRGAPVTLLCNNNICQTGWKVFVDANTNCTFDETAAIREYDGLGDNTLNTSGVPCIAFNAQGQKQVGTPEQTFYLCDTRSPPEQYGRKITVNITGRAESNVLDPADTCTPP
jgi:type IV fimbrial biogenesis protein FimT